MSQNIWNLISRIAADTWFKWNEMSGVIRENNICLSKSLQDFRTENIPKQIISKSRKIFKSVPAMTTQTSQELRSTK